MGIQGHNINYHVNSTVNTEKGKDSVSEQDKEMYAGYVHLFRGSYNKMFISMEPQWKLQLMCFSNVPHNMTHKEQSIPVKQTNKMLSYDYCDELYFLTLL